MSSKQLQEHIESIMKICPRRVYGQMHKLFARTKHGDFDYTNRDKH